MYWNRYIAGEISHSFGFREDRDNSPSQSPFVFSEIESIIPVFFTVNLLVIVFNDLDNSYNTLFLYRAMEEEHVVEVNLVLVTDVIFRNKSSSEEVFVLGVEEADSHTEILMRFQLERENSYF